MTDHRTYPLQTGSNCVAFSYWVAMQEALWAADPLRKLDFTPADVERVTGAPASVVEAAFKDNGLYAKNWHFEYAGHMSDTPIAPCVWASWAPGFAHAICQIDASRMYDPALGEVVPLNLDKTASPVSVVCISPERFPYAHWSYRFGLVRWFLRGLA